MKIEIASPGNAIDTKLGGLEKFDVTAIDVSIRPDSLNVAKVIVENLPLEITAEAELFTFINGLWYKLVEHGLESPIYRNKLS